MRPSSRLVRSFTVVSTLAAVACGSPSGEQLGSAASGIVLAPTPPIPVGVTPPPPPDHSADFMPPTQSVPGPLPATPTDAMYTFGPRARAAIANEACDVGNDFRNGGTFPGENWSLDALAMIAFDGECNLNGTREDASARWPKVDAALAQITAGGTVMGSSFGKIAAFGNPNGELDTTIKDLVPILEQYGSRISPATFNHVLQFLAGVDSGGYTAQYDEHDAYPGLLNEIAAGTVLPLAEALVPPLLPPLPMLPLALIDVNYIAIPETENHLLLIHSTRFLVNEMLEARSPSPTTDNTQNGMKAYWLTRLSQILQHDFQEYNSRPYNHYALFAIANLADYAKDRDVQTAARAVLDFAAAKYAVSTSQQRRNSPWRRRKGEYRDDYYANEMMDEMGCWFAVQEGFDDFGAPPTSTGYPWPAACKYMSRVGLSSYRVPPMIMDQAMNHHPNFQIFAGGTNPFHGAPGAIEIYDDEGPYMIAAGGIPNDVGNDLTIHTRIGPDVEFPDVQPDDYPIVLPTVLLPNRKYGDYRDAQDISRMVRIAGGGSGNVGQVPNICVGPGFACGVNPVVPPALLQFTTVNGPWSFVDFGSFYVVVFQTSLPGGANTSVGFFEAVPAGAFTSFTQFQSKVLAANPNPAAIISGSATTDPQAVFDFDYVSARGGVISGQYAWNLPRMYPIQQLRGLPLPSPNTDTWPLASGVVGAQHDGKVSIGVNSQPWLSPCVLDLSVPTYPQRTMCDLPPSDYSPPPPPPPPSLGWMHIDVPPGGNTSYFFPSNAIQVGYQASLPEYVCRVTTNHVDRIGRFDRLGNCWTPQPTGSLFGNLGENYTSFDVLTFNVAGVDTLEFTPATSGAIPPNAWTAGTAENGVPLQICQVANGDGSVYPGQLGPSGCSVVINGTVTNVASYQVGVDVPLPPPPPPSSSGGTTTGGGGGGGAGTGGGQSGCKTRACDQ